MLADQRKDKGPKGREFGVGNGRPGFQRIEKGGRDELLAHRALGRNAVLAAIDPACGYLHDLDFYGSQSSSCSVESIGF